LSKPHGDKEEEMVTKARAEVDKLRRTILAIENNNCEGEKPTLMLERQLQHGGKLYLTNEMSLRRWSAIHLASFSLLCETYTGQLAKTKPPFHPVEDFLKRQLS
jgi:hypothetical protein